METSANTYSPLDLSTLSLPNISSDKDLDSEISKVCETLKDTRKLIRSLTIFALETYDWKKRTESMKRVQEISLLFNEILEGDSPLNPNVYLN